MIKEEREVPYRDHAKDITLLPLHTFRYLRAEPKTLNLNSFYTLG